MLTLLGGIISHSVFSFEKTQPCDYPIIIFFIVMESCMCSYKKIKRNLGSKRNREFVNHLFLHCEVACAL
jgi:hypothetical protein